MHRALFSLTVALLIAGCTTAPVTGRQQLVLLSQPQATEMGREAYQENLATKGVSSDPQHNEMVRRVGQRDRKTVVYGKSADVRCDLGGRRMLQKQTNSKQTMKHDWTSIYTK